tara:strand:+ start:102 stop:329 length:228 start_codon:yes stop_codon:yes gene_type:complete
LRAVNPFVKKSETFFRPLQAALLANQGVQGLLVLQGKVSKLHHGGGNLEVGRLGGLGDEVGEVGDDLGLAHGFVS